VTAVRETATNRPMLEAWRGQGVLMLQRCQACGRAIFYPRSICPACWGDRLAWFRASGNGSIVSFSRVHRGLPAKFAAEVPIVLAEIRLDEGALMIARVVTGDPAAISSGDAVELVSPDAAKRFDLPTFQPGRPKLSP
jgi:uncharacterized OB-fold protein